MSKVIYKDDILDAILVAGYQKLSNIETKSGSLTKKHTKEIVQAVFDNISEELAKGNTVNVRDFGTFKVAEREGVSFGKKYKAKRVTLKTAKALKEEL